MATEEKSKPSFFRTDVRHFSQGAILSLHLEITSTEWVAEMLGLAKNDCAHFHHPFVSYEQRTCSYTLLFMRRCSSTSRLEDMFTAWRFKRPMSFIPLTSTS